MLVKFFLTFLDKQALSVQQNVPIIDGDELLHDIVQPSTHDVTEDNTRGLHHCSGKV